MLKHEWGFDGMVMSDWRRIHTTVEPVNAGLDLEMPGPARAYGTALADAVRRGEVPERALDDIVTRLLSTFRRLDGSRDSGDDREWTRDGDETRRFARRVAAAAMVLVKNDDRILPLALAADWPRGRHRSERISGEHHGRRQLASARTTPDTTAHGAPP